MKVLKNARLIDGTGAAPLKDATIVIEGNKIKEITTSTASNFPADAEIVNCSGMAVLPGLIDCHDHMANHRYDLAHRWASTSRKARGICAPPRYCVRRSKPAIR